MNTDVSILPADQTVVNCGNQPIPTYRQKYKATIIYHSDTPDSAIADIPLEKVYEWVRTGLWKQKHFLRWAKVVRLIE